MNRIVPFVFCVVILTIAARTQPSELPVDPTISRDIKARLTGEKNKPAINILHASDTASVR